MTPCGQNYVTPSMIKKGHINIGDKINFDDDMQETMSQVTASASPAALQTSAEEAAPVHANAPVPAPQAPSVPQAPPAAESPGSSNVSRKAPQPAQPYQPATPPYPQSSTRPARFDSIPLIFEQMTNYAESLSSGSGETPSFNIPSHPMVPPEYDQSLDYDSMQYMNGFLRTQIGRGLMVQQLIGSGNTVDRYGFLVGVGNNYLVLQDFSDGNIMLIDFYTVKYVYIYYSQPVYPSFQFPEARMMY